MYETEIWQKFLPSTVRIRTLSIYQNYSTLKGERGIKEVSRIFMVSILRFNDIPEETCHQQPE